MRRYLPSWIDHKGYIVDMMEVEVEWTDHMMAKADMKGLVDIDWDTWIGD